jgi:hypothetical protein
MWFFAGLLAGVTSAAFLARTMASLLFGICNIDR